MLPPIEDSVLQSNPKFAALHATLANNILNPNGSTKNHHAQKELEAVTEVQPHARAFISSNKITVPENGPNPRSKGPSPT
jgi:hypothetical protein